LYTTIRTSLEVVTKTFVEETKQCGLKADAVKTKGMILGTSLTARCVVTITLEGGEIQMVELF